MAKEKETKPMANTVIGSSLVVDGEISGEEPLTILHQRLRQHLDRVQCPPPSRGSVNGAQRNGGQFFSFLR